jgi:hypothetical protein
VNVRNKKCEGCQLKQPAFGLPAEGKARWCSGCAKGHAGAMDATSKKCEGCGLKRSSYGLPSEGKTRWCAGCAKAHAGAESLEHTAGSRRTQAGGSPQKKPKVTGGPSISISGVSCQPRWVGQFAYCN